MVKKRTPRAQKGRNRTASSSSSYPPSRSSTNSVSTSATSSAIWSTAPALPGRAAGLIGFDHQFFQLQKGYLFPCGFVDRTQRNGEAQPFVKGHRFLQVVCRQADVLQAIYGFRDFFHVHASLSSTSISTFIVVSRFASMYRYAAR